MSALDVVGARGEAQRRRIADALRAEWRMIAAVSLRPCRDRPGFEAEIRLDPIVVKGSFEQQGYPQTPAALAKLEARRRAALDECVGRVNEGLLGGDRIRSFFFLCRLSHAGELRHHRHRAPGGYVAAIRASCIRAKTILRSAEIFAEVRGGGEPGIVGWWRSTERCAGAHPDLHPHPIVSEDVVDAARAVDGWAIHA